MTQTPLYWAIVPAAGIGRRMESDCPKQYLPLRDKTVIEHAVAALFALPSLEAVLVAINPSDALWPQLALSREQRIETVAGGEERHQSVFNALLALNGRACHDDWVLVHDAVRPCVTRDCIQHLLDQLGNHPVGGLLGYSLGDTLKKVDEQGCVKATVDRSGLWAAATPQVFRYGVLLKAMEQALKSGSNPTDEAMAVENFGLRPRMVPGRRSNIKITVPGDLELAELILQTQESS
jgi:2-C-methyl-D-erythritol 4-phosphate cytidylyltransferase